MNTRTRVHHSSVSLLDPGPGSVVRMVKIGNWQGRAIQLSRNDVIFLKKSGVIEEQADGRVIWTKGQGFKLPMVRELRKILKNEENVVKCVSNVLYLGI